MSRIYVIKVLLLFYILGLTQFSILSPSYAAKETIDFNDGVIALGSNNYDEAIVKFQSALRINPKYVKAYNNLGIALQKKGDLNNAILAYRQALQIDPAYGNALYNLGLCLKDAGAVEEAIETLQRFISMNPNDSDAIKAKWIANDLRDQIQNKDPKTEKYYLGSWLVSDQNYIDAIPPLEKALQMDPTDYKSRFALGIAYKGAGNFPAAAEIFNNLSQENPQDYLVFYNLAESLEKMGDIQNANQTWQKCIMLAPNSEASQRLKTSHSLGFQQNLQQDPNGNYPGITTNNFNTGFNNMSGNTTGNSDYKTTQTPQQNYQTPYQPNDYASNGYFNSNNNNSNNINNAYQNSNTGQYQQNSQQQPNNFVPQYKPQTTYGAGFSSPTPGTPASRNGKTRIAVLDFDYSGIRPWWTGDWNIGKGVSSLLVGELVRSGTYSVIERTALEQVMNEQKLSTGAEFDPSTAATIGKLLGVNVLILGNITNFGIEDKGKGLNTDLPLFAIVSGIQSKSSTALVSFDIRAVSVDTGEILSVTTVSGKSKRRGMLIDFSKNGNGGNIDFSSSNFTDSVLGEATQAAVKDAASQIAQQYEAITKATINTTAQDVGVVAYVGVQGVIINAGNGSGLKVGNHISIERVSDVVKDPMTGNIIKSITTNVAEIELTEIDANSATGKIINASNDPQVGDIARFRADLNVVIPKNGASTSITGEIINKNKK